MIKNNHTDLSVKSLNEKCIHMDQRLNEIEQKLGEKNELQSIKKQTENSLEQLQKENEAHIKDKQDEVKAQAATENVGAAKTQEFLKQASAENDEKVEQLLALVERYHKLENSNRELLGQKQNIEKKLEDVSKQFQVDKEKHEANIKDKQKEVETYKIEIETEKEKATKTQEVLKQISAEKEEKANQILALEESNRKLLHQNQSLQKQLKDVSKQLHLYKEKCDAHIEDTESEAESFKFQIETERAKATEAQKILKQISNEKEEKEKQLLLLEASYHKLEKSYQELLCKKENIEKQLEDFSSQYHKLVECNHELLCQKLNIDEQMEDVLNQLQIDKEKYEAHIKDHQNEVEAYKIQIETEKEKATKEQEFLTQQLAEKEKEVKLGLASLEEANQRYEESNHELLHRIQNIEKQEECLKQYELLLTELLTKNRLIKSAFDEKNINRLKDDGKMKMEQKVTAQPQKGFMK